MVNGKTSGETADDSNPVVKCFLEDLHFREEELARLHTEGAKLEIQIAEYHLHRSAELQAEIDRLNAKLNAK